MSTNRVKDKEEMVDTHTHEYYLVIKKNEMMPFAATGRDLELVILIKSEILYDIP